MALYFQLAQQVCIHNVPLVSPSQYAPLNHIYSKRCHGSDAFSNLTQSHATHEACPGSPLSDGFHTHLPNLVVRSLGSFHSPPPPHENCASEVSSDIAEEIWLLIFGISLFVNISIDVKLSLEGSPTAFGFIKKLAFDFLRAEMNTCFHLGFLLVVTAPLKPPVVVTPKEIVHLMQYLRD